MNFNKKKFCLLAFFLVLSSEQNMTTERRCQSNKIQKQTGRIHWNNKPPLMLITLDKNGIEHLFDVCWMRVQNIWIILRLRYRKAEKNIINETKTKRPTAIQERLRFFFFFSRSRDLFSYKIYICYFVNVVVVGGGGAAFGCDDSGDGEQIQRKLKKDAIFMFRFQITKTKKKIVLKKSVVDFEYFSALEIQFVCSTESNHLLAYELYGILFKWAPVCVVLEFTMSH